MLLSGKSHNHHLLTTVLDWMKLTDLTRPIPLIEMCQGMLKDLKDHYFLHLTRFITVT